MFAVEPRIESFLRSAQGDFMALLELLGLEPVMVRPSPYQGIELVLSWPPHYRCITTVGLGNEGPIFCYSKHEFAGARYNGLGDWELQL